MKQFITILGFELKSYFKNKIFIGVTILLVIVSAGVMFFPALSEMLGGGTEENAAEAPVMLVGAPAVSGIDQEMLGQYFSAAFSGYQVRVTDEPAEAVRDQVTSGGCGVCLYPEFSHRLYVLCQ